MRRITLITLVVACIFLFSFIGYCQDTGGAFDLVDEIAKETEISPPMKVVGNFSMAGLFGTILFGGVGFVSFAYGKNTSNFKSMTIGVLLLGFPYFIHTTTGIYAVGSILSIALYFTRR